MFGFIKMIERFLAKIRSNKRLWFTSIFITATLGISLSIFMLISTTDRISNEVYISQTKEFNLRYKDLEKIKEKKLQNLASVLSYDNALIDKIQTNDTAGMAQIENELNAKVAGQDKGFITFKFYSTQNKTEVFRNTIVSTIQSKNNIFGLEVLLDGIFYVYLLPILKDDKVIGVIEVKESIYALKDSFDRLNQEFAFLLDSKMTALLAIQNRDGIYQDIGKNYLIDSKIYTNKTLANLTSLNDQSIQKIAQGNYVVNKDSFLNGRLVRDTNGVDIGLFIFGENVNKEGGFINMAQKMTNQVVSIALGLIVSLLLFLF
ncbi:MAG: hypothetical protein PHR87_11700 [Sulfurospirillaceae bacterium]|nr:hypothetical protein [Sulfurospirillaceae bacterium]